MNISKIPFGQTLKVITFCPNDEITEQSFNIKTGLYPQSGGETHFVVQPYSTGLAISIAERDEDGFYHSTRIAEGVRLSNLRRIWNSLFDMMLIGKDATITVDQKNRTANIDFNA